MAEDPNKPRVGDLVLGGKALAPVGGVVLGGIEGVKRRLGRGDAASRPYPEEARVAALTEALKYGEAGLDLVIQAFLGDSSEQVQSKAHSILRERAEPRIKQVLQKHVPSVSPGEINCSRLAVLLAIGKWKEADEETAAILLRASGREEAGCLRLVDIERLSPKLVSQIDRLWLGCSKGHFGLSVQREIWQSVGGSATADYEVWYRFCDRLKWRIDNCWVEYDKLTFSLAAVKGHLPFLVVGGFGVAFCLSSLFSRLNR